MGAGVPLPGTAPLGPRRPRQWGAVEVTVRHVGERCGPSHFRLLCALVFPWSFPGTPFDTPDFAIY
ncbi:MAG: hypothetical protein ACRDYD_04430 [Acidimicrobiales bacterium]